VVTLHYRRRERRRWGAFFHEHVDMKAAHKAVTESRALVLERTGLPYEEVKAGQLFYAARIGDRFVLRVSGTLTQLHELGFDK